MSTFREFYEESAKQQLTESSTPAELIGRLEKAVGSKLKPEFNEINGVDVNILDTEDGDTSIQIELMNAGDMSKLTSYLKGLKFKVKKIDKENIEIS